MAQCQGPAAELTVAAAEALGQGAASYGLRVAQSHTDVYYVPIDMSEMSRIEDFYTYGDPLISAANKLRFDLSFGKGFLLRYADRQDIKPEDVYDYTQIIRKLLERALRKSDMFGFVAFVQRNEAAAAEVDRQREQKRTGHEPTPEEVSQKHAQECSRLIVSKLGDDDEQQQRPAKRSGRRRRRGDTDTDTDTDDGGLERDGDQGKLSDTVAKPLSRPLTLGADPTNNRRDPDNFDKQINPDAVSERPAPRIEFQQFRNGTTLLASEARLVLNEAEQRTVQLQKSLDRELARRQSILDMLISIENVTIIEPSEGTFYLEVDNLLHTRRVVWAPSWRRPFAPSSLNRTAEGRLRHVDYDPNVTVFVWPNRMPSDTGHVRSDYLEIMRLRQMVLESENNSMIADYVNSHPIPVVYQGRGPVSADLNDLPEEDIYGMDVINGRNAFSKDNMTPGEMQTYRREVRDAIRLEDSVSQFNQQALVGRVQGMSGNNQYRSQVAGAYGASAPANRQHVFESTSYLELPGGLQLGGQIKADVIVNLAELRQAYETRLSSALGVPITFLQGQNVNVGSLQGADSNSNTLAMIMRTTVSSDRDNMSQFFDTLYDTLNRDADNEALATELGSVRAKRARIEKTQQAYARLLRNRYDLVRDAPQMSNELNSLHSEKARLCAIENEVRRIATLMYRLRLHFVKTPFVESADVVQMYQLGALSAVEMANILRQNAGLDKIDEAEQEKNCRDFADCAMQLNPELRLKEEELGSRQKLDSQQLKLQERQSEQQNKLSEKELKIKEKVANKPTPKPAAKAK